MRVLLDNCVPRCFGNHLTGYETSSVVDLGWANLDDGKLLDAMAGYFDALITMDKGSASNSNWAIVHLVSSYCAPEATGFPIFCP